MNGNQASCGGGSSALNPNAAVFVPRFGGPPSAASETTTSDITPATPQEPPQGGEQQGVPGSAPPPDSTSDTSNNNNNNNNNNNSNNSNNNTNNNNSSSARFDHGQSLNNSSSSNNLVKETSPLVVGATNGPMQNSSSSESAVDVKSSSIPQAAAEMSQPKQPEDSSWEDLGDEYDEPTAATNQSAAPKKEKSTTAANQPPKIKKEYVNVIFIGHVDAGKSTIGGQLMYLTGQVDKRTLDKYEREAKEMNRESWYLSWALDTNAEEREKGKTVQVGRASFETDLKHFTILDAPGHKSFVPNMIGGASQADLAVLVISARKGEFEAGLDRGGQTREHAMLVKTAGVRHLIVLINKMDDSTVNWDKKRFDEAKDKLLPVLKKLGFVENKDLYFMPCSGFTGAFIKEVADEKTCSWYRGPSFIEYLDSLPPLSRAREGPIRVVLCDKYNDMGTVVMGKVESGVVTKGQNLLLMPNKTLVQALQLWSDDDETEEIGPGENVKLKLKGVEEDAIMSGFVLCSPDNYCKVGKVFDAQVVILEHKSIICPGYSAVLHIHAAVEEISIKKLLCLIDRKTGEKSTLHPRFVKQDQTCIMRLESNEMFCLEPFKDFPQMGRFVIRDEARTIAVGKILKVIE